MPPPSSPNLVLEAGEILPSCSSGKKQSHYDKAMTKESVPINLKKKILHRYLGPLHAWELIHLNRFLWPTRFKPNYGSTQYSNFPSRKAGSVNSQRRRP